MKNDKSILWSVLEKYDNYIDYKNFCDSLSNCIQDKCNSDDMIVIFKNLQLIDKSDRIKIDNAIGSKIDFCMFSV